MQPPDHAGVDPVVQQLQAQLQLQQQQIATLQQQQAAQTDAFRRILEGKWDGADFGADSAEAELYALNPTLQGKVTVVPFPKAG